MPITAPRDRLRLQIGDTDITSAIFTDDELDTFLTERDDNILLAAADACDAAAAKFSRGFDFKWKDGTFSRSQIVTHYKELAKALRARAASDGALPIWSFPPAEDPLVF
jgi:hypothetical protein